MISLTVVDVSEAQVVATQAELLVGAGDVDSGASLASVFGIARWALLFLAYLVAVSFIDRV